MDYIKSFGTELFIILTEMAPYLMLGFIFAGLLHLLFPKKRVRKYMGQNNFKSIFNAALLGVPLPLCSCGVIPTGISFYKHGASKASTVSFLISTPQTGVDSIFVTYSMLGLPLAIIRPIVAFVTGLFGGLITKKIDPEKAETVLQNNENGDELPKGLLPKIKEMFRYSFIDFLQDISNWLIIGLLIAALISVIVPDDFFADKIPNDFLGMLVILVISIPVYICATASVPVAAVLMLKGAFSRGCPCSVLNGRTRHKCCNHNYDRKSSWEKIINRLSWGNNHRCVAFRSGYRLFSSCRVVQGIRTFWSYGSRS